MPDERVPDDLHAAVDTELDEAIRRVERVAVGGRVNRLELQHVLRADLVELLRDEVTLTNDTLLRGNSNVSMTRPSRPIVTWRAGVSACSSLAFSSSAYCAGVGFCGEPIFSHAAYELLCVSSMR